MVKRAGVLHYLCLEKTDDIQMWSQAQCWIWPLQTDLMWTCTVYSCSCQAPKKAVIYCDIDCWHLLSQSLLFTMINPFEMPSVCPKYSRKSQTKAVCSPGVSLMSKVNFPYLTLTELCCTPCFDVPLIHNVWLYCLMTMVLSSPCMASSLSHCPIHLTQEPTKVWEPFSMYSNFCAYVHALLHPSLSANAHNTYFGNSHSSGHLSVGLHLPSVWRKGKVMFVDSNSSLEVLLY